ncbi:hypothetical protein M422DRAFT_253316 [Sphaerobolus stellatus SS14]|uniref:Winged helix-turn helix domain-containing protein n=1 Tax=Sphaerobolus stellatus (strain SS14) TaxID=990650 RepID=A0A0C9UK90_SPHS4|nr:hypothetical protein M422DRAFT_253316 [Sphaerobolus stellatus SS14]
MPRVVLQDQRKRKCYEYAIRKHVIHLRYKQEKTIDEIALDLDMSRRTVERILHLWRMTGEVVSQGQTYNDSRAKILTDKEMKVLVEYATRWPDMYLDELQQQLCKQHGVIIGLSTLWRMLKSLGLTCKKLAHVAAEHNEDVCNHYRFEIGAEAPNHLVFVDESCIDCRTSYHLKGWAPRGKRAIISSKFMQGQGWATNYWHDYRW